MFRLHSAELSFIIMAYLLVSSKPNSSREGDGKHRVFQKEDGRAAEGIIFVRLGFFIEIEIMEYSLLY
jgi:hypothetical protein